MSIAKPSIPKGSRDFSPLEMTRRNFIFSTISEVFKKYGYQEIQTPAMENLSTLTGKYGDEGDKLMFRILNSGDYLSKIPEGLISSRDSAKFSPQISEKALRYDLTVPFARYVVMHKNDISFPFKRYQIQPVWRADRPQKGRYREFYQCDADVVGSDSLIHEAEFVLIYKEALSALGLTDFTVKINNRKILAGIAEVIGKADLIIDMTVAIDKLDKIGIEGVKNELLERGFTDSDIQTLGPIIELRGSNEEKLSGLQTILADSKIGIKGLNEIRQIFHYLEAFNAGSTYSGNVEVDITLARGLNYYTGAIFEVKSNEVAMGSIGGGGRYDDLTGMFGVKDLAGVGISFGADRIYDVLNELGLFPQTTSTGTQVLICAFDELSESYALPILRELRQAGIRSELYPPGVKMKKQLSYADDKRIPYVVMIGSEEVDTGLLTVKSMETGQQQQVAVSLLIDHFENLINQD